MVFDPLKSGFQFVDEQRADEKGNGQTQRIAEEHQNADEHLPLLRCEHQCGAEESSHARRPADRKDQTEEERGKKAHVTMECIGFYPLEQGNVKYTEEIKTEKDYNRSGDDIHKSLILSDQTAEAPCQGTEKQEYKGESADKPQCVFDGFGGGALAAAGKIGNIDGQHRQKARRNKGDDALQKGNKIDHRISFPQSE